VRIGVWFRTDILKDVTCEHCQRMVARVINAWTVKPPREPAMPPLDQEEIDFLNQQEDDA
jgi:hypothetical protein